MSQYARGHSTQALSPSQMGGAGTSGSRTPRPQSPTTREFFSPRHRLATGGRSGRAVCRNKVQRPLDRRARRGSGISVRVMTYNLLADQPSAYAHLGGTMDGEVMEWEYRFPRLVEEIIYWAPDVVCLQEVTHYEDFAARLGAAGYVGRYKGRTRDHIDGCAVFWKAQKFTLDSEMYVEYFRESHPLLDRDNVGMVLTLASTAPGSPRIVVGNTHILYNTKRGDIKLAQISLFLEAVASARAGVGPVAQCIVCGDFNVAPISPLYQFIATGHLDAKGLDSRLLSGTGTAKGRTLDTRDWKIDSEAHRGIGSVYGRAGSDTVPWERFHYVEPQAVRGKKQKRPVNDPLMQVEVTHDLAPLISAYAERPTALTTGEPAYTCYHSSCIGTMDYIWVTTGLRILEVARMPSVPLMNYCRGLPNRHWSSDHISLVTTLELT